MDVGLHRVARIAAACWGATLPPETTATTFWPGSTATFPARSAAVGRRRAELAGELHPRVEPAERLARARPRETSTDSTPSARADLDAALAGERRAQRVGRARRRRPARSAPPRAPSCSAVERSGSTRDHAHVGPPRLQRRRDPADEAAAADRHDDDVGHRDVLEDLEPDRALAGDHRRRRRTDGRACGPSPRAARASRSNAVGRARRPPGRPRRRSRASPRPSARRRPATSRSARRRPPRARPRRPPARGCPAEIEITPRALLLVGQLRRAG